MQKTIISEITSTLKAAREKYAKEIKKAVDENSIENIIEFSNDVKNINDALLIFGSNETKKKNSNVGKKDNIKKEKNIKKVSAEKKNENVLTLDDNLVSKRPTKVYIERSNFDVSSFRDVVRVVCCYFFNKDAEQFKLLAELPSVNGDEHRYFSLTNNTEDNMDEISNAKGEKIFVNISKLAANNMFFLKRMLVALNFEPSKIKMNIDQNYTRKERTKKTVVNK